MCCSVLVSAGGAAACGIAQGLATLPVAAAMVWGTQSLKMVGPAEGKAAAMDSMPPSAAPPPTAVNPTPLQHTDVMEVDSGGGAGGRLRPVQGAGRARSVNTAAVAASGMWEIYSNGL